MAYRLCTITSISRPYVIPQSAYRYCIRNSEPIDLNLDAYCSASPTQPSDLESLVGRHSIRKGRFLNSDMRGAASNNPICPLKDVLALVWGTRGWGFSGRGRCADSANCNPPSYKDLLASFSFPHKKSRVVRRRNSSDLDVVG